MIGRNLDADGSKGRPRWVESSSKMGRKSIEKVIENMMKSALNKQSNNLRRPLNVKGKRSKSGPRGWRQRPEGLENIARDSMYNPY